MKNKKGSILIIALWILAILAILSAVLFRNASNDITLAKYEADNIKATYLAKAGVMKMMTELIKDTNPYDSLNEDWNRTKENPKQLRIGEDVVLYAACDEDRRLNLNGALLKKGHMVRLGIDERLAERIIEYKNKKTDKGFEFTEELFLVEEMTKESYSRLKNFITIYRGKDDKVNINTADENVLYVVTGDYNVVQKILEYRKGPDDKEATEDDGIFMSSGDIGRFVSLDPALFSVKSTVFRIWASSSFSEESGGTRMTEAVVDRSAKIFSWKEY